MNRKPKKLPRVVADWLRFVSLNMKLSGFSGRLSPKIEEHALRLYREGKLKPRKPLMALGKRQTRWVPDLVAMRAWKGERAITRTIVLLVCLDQLLVPGGLQDWLDRRRPDLDGESPVGLIKRGEWTVIADLIDDMLTGAPS